jgi:hypothetical protein
LRLIHPELFEDLEKFFKSEKPIPALVKRFTEAAEADEAGTTAEILIQQELLKQTKLLKNALDGRYHSLEKYIRELKEAIQYLRSLEKENDLKVAEPQELWETAAIRRDFYTAKRNSDHYKEMPLTIDGFREYLLPNNRLMRVRLLHALKAEEIVGVDLIYEQVDIIKKRIRFVHLQYKMWDENNFNLKPGKEIRQMSRMAEKLCDSKFCSRINTKDTPSYRMPFCCAFYRPTHKKQSQNAQLMTTGIHLPLCFVSDFKPKISINKDEVYTQGLSNNTFDELFRNGLIGSAWMSMNKVQKFYEENKIINNPNSFVINVRDEIGHDKKKLNTVKRLRDLI